MKILNITIQDATHEKLMSLKKRWALNNITETITKAINIAFKGGQAK